MKKNGFTLIELLGVIIILALLVLLVFPSIINSIKNTSKKIDKETLNLIYKASDIYIAQNNDNFPKTNGNKYIISISDLVASDLLPNDLTLSNKEILNDQCVQVTYNNKYTYELKNGNICVNNVIVVDLVEGLTPIIYNGSNWEVADTSKEWYNYSKQEWANAAILSEGVSTDPGTELTDLNNQVKAMFVYIPRYEYKIDGDYGKGGTSASFPGEIEVNFISMSKKKSTTGYTIHPAFTFGRKQLYGIWVGKFELSHIEYYNSTGNYVDDMERYKYVNQDPYQIYDYHSYDILNYDGIICNSTSCETAENLRILPNMKSLRRFSPASFFYSVRTMSTEDNSFGLSNADTHVIKNSEWGAVAYLSQSKYGKYGNSNYEGANKEIYINNSSSKITGSSAGNPGTNNNETPKGTCEYNDLDNNCGAGASTTGNITGIYDMNGGSSEFVMALLNKVSKNDGLFGLKDGYSYVDCSFESEQQCISSNWINLPNSKYYDYLEFDTMDYVIEDYEHAVNGKISLVTVKSEKGQALSELKSDFNSDRAKTAIGAAKTGGYTWTWYNDTRYFISADLGNFVSSNIGPWLNRGGSSYGNYDVAGTVQSDAGIFSGGEWHLVNAQASRSQSTRVVLVSD